MKDWNRIKEMITKGGKVLNINVTIKVIVGDTDQEVTNDQIIAAVEEAIDNLELTNYPFIETEVVSIADLDDE